MRAVHRSATEVPHVRSRPPGPGPLRAAARQRTPPDRSARPRTDAGGAGLGSDRGRPRAEPHFHLRRLPPDHGLRERAGVCRPSRGPPPGPRRALRPLRRALFDPRCRWPERKRLHLRGQGRRPRRLTCPIFLEERRMKLRVPLTALACMAIAACTPAPEAPPADPPTELMAVDTPPPAYPEALACDDVGGQTVLAVTVGPEGRPTNVRVKQS